MSFLPILIGGAVALAVTLWTAASLSDDPDLVEWSFTHWAFTYEHGVTKRALVGEVVSWFVPPSSLFSAVHWLSLLVFLAAATGLIFFFWRPFMVSGGGGRLAFAVLATTHPATLSHLLYDAGRFDQIGLLIALACLVSIDRGRARALLLACLCGTAILVHEAFLLMYVPLVMAYWAYSGTKSEARWLMPAAVTLVVLGVTLSVILQGAPDIGRQQYYRELVDLHGPWIRESSIGVLYGSLTAEIGRSLGLLASGRRIFQHLTLALFLLPTALIAAKIVRRRIALERSEGNADPSVAWLLIAAASPLSLYAIGIDFARWWALTITNLLLTLALIMGRSRQWSRAVDETLAENMPLVWAAMAISVVVGPLGVAASPFPQVEPILREAAMAAWHAFR